MDEKDDFEIDTDIEIKKLDSAKEGRTLDALQSQNFMQAIQLDNDYFSSARIQKEKVCQEKTDYSQPPQKGFFFGFDNN